MAAQQAGDMLQRFIADFMTVGVVDSLEIIDIDDCDRVAATTGAGGTETALALLGQGPAVGQRCQVIG